MRRAVDGRFLPHAVIALRPSGESAAEVAALVPFLDEPRPIDGKATAYICEGYACSLPATDVGKLTSLIEPRRRAE